MWILRAQDRRRLEASNMYFMRVLVEKTTVSLAGWSARLTINLEVAGFIPDTSTNLNVN